MIINILIIAISSFLIFLLHIFSSSFHSIALLMTKNRDDLSESEKLMIILNSDIIIPAHKYLSSFAAKIPYRMQSLIFIILVLNIILIFTYDSNKALIIPTILLFGITIRFRFYHGSNFDFDSSTKYFLHKSPISNFSYKDCYQIYVTANQKIMNPTTKPTINKVLNTPTNFNEKKEEIVEVIEKVNHTDPIQISDNINDAKMFNFSTMKYEEIDIDIYERNHELINTHVLSSDYCKKLNKSFLSKINSMAFNAKEYVDIFDQLYIEEGITLTKKYIDFETLVYKNTIGYIYINDLAPKTDDIYSNFYNLKHNYLKAIKFKNKRRIYENHLELSILMDFINIAFKHFTHPDDEYEIILDKSIYIENIDKLFEQENLVLNTFKKNQLLISDDYLPISFINNKIMITRTLHLNQIRGLFHNYRYFNSDGFIEEKKVVFIPNTKFDNILF